MPNSLSSAQMNRLLLNLQKVDGDAARGWTPEQLQLLMAKAEMNDGDVIFRGMWKGKTHSLGAHGQAKFSVDEVEQTEIAKARKGDQSPETESEFSIDASMGAGESWVWVSSDNAWPRADVPYDYAYWQPVLMNTNAGTDAQYSLLANPPEVSWLSARASLEHSKWQPVLSDAGVASDLAGGSAQDSLLTDSWLKPDTGWSTGYGANDYGYWQPVSSDSGQRWLFASADAPPSVYIPPDVQPYLPLIAVGGLLLMAGGGGGSGGGTVTVPEAGGGSGPTFATFSGVVVDGYVRGAVMFVDLNSNGVKDASDYALGTTSADGSFSFSVPDNISGTIVATGGINIDTGLPNDLVLKAPSGSAVINPLTTVVQAFMDADASLTLSDAMVRVTSMFALDTTLDLTAFDPLDVDNFATSLPVQKVATQLATLMTVAQRAEIADTVTTQLIDLYTTFASAGDPYDLSDAGVLSFALGLSTDFVTDNLSTFSSLDADLVSQVHGLDASNAAIKNAATFEEIASAQASALDTAASAAPVTVDLLATGDSGVSSSDHVTQETNLTVRVTLPTEAGAMHDLVVGDVVSLRYDGVGVVHLDANSDGRGDADVQVVLTAQHLSDGYVDLQLSIAHYGDGAGDMVAWFTDKAGNLSAVNDALSVQLVTQAVTGGVVMTDNHNGTFTATLDFGADAVYGLSEADWSVTGGTVIAGSMAQVGNAYSVNIQSTADVQAGLMVVGVDTSGVTGVAGNAVSVDGVKQSYDSLAPHVLSVDTPSVGTFGAGQDLVFTVHFSENVSFDASASALSIRVGADERTATFTSGSSDTSTWVYTYKVQSIDGATGSGLSIVGLTGAVGAQDAAGNVSDAADLFVEKTVSGVVVDGSTQGQVADGYISGATVFADNDGSGSLNSGDSIAIANATGGLKIYGATGPMVMYGGTDISTGLDFGVQYEAPVGFTVINPITTLVQAMVVGVNHVPLAPEGVSVVDDTYQGGYATATAYDGNLRTALFGTSAGPDAAQLASYEPFHEVMASGTVDGISAAVSYQQLAAVIATVVEVTSQAMSVLDTAHTQREHSTTVFDALAVALSDGGVSSAGALASLADASTGALADVLAATLGAGSSINDAGAATAAGVVLAKAVGSIASIALTDDNASGAIDSSDGLKTLTDITKAQQTAQGKSGDVLGQYLTDMGGSYGQTVDQYMYANSLADLGTHYATFTDFFNGTVATASVGVIVPVSYEIRGGTISDANANVGVLEGQPGDGGTLTFTVTRGGDTSGESAIGWSVANNTGVDASQFAAGSALSGTLDFGAGETQREITLVLEGNTVREPNYALRVDLIDESGVAKIDHPSAFANIVDDDPFIPVISAHNPADVLVGDAVPLSLSLDYFDATAPITVELVASGGTLANYTAGDFASATLSELNALLAAVTFTAETGAVDASVTMNVSVDGTSKTAFSTSPIQVHSAPVIDADTTTVTVDGGAAVDLPAVALYDVDSDSVQVTLSASGGLLRVPQADGTLITMSNWVFSGTPEAATQALAELSFWAQPGARAGVVKVQLSDGDAMTAGATQLLNFAIQAAAPVIHVPSYQSLVTRGVASQINDIWVSDTDSNNVSVVLTAANGALNVATSSAVTLIGNGSSTLTVQGSVDAVNAQLISLTFTASAGTLVPSLTAKVSDGTTTTSATTVSLNAIANTPPDAGGNLVLDAVVTEDGGAQALGITADGLTLNDPDGGTVTHVRVLSVIGGSLDGITSVGATSTPLSLAAFEALTFTPAKNFNGEASIKYVVVDPVLTSLNSSASTITFEVAAVNDAPSVTGTASSVTYVEHGGSVLLAPTVTLQDVDSATLSKVEIVADANWSATSTLSVAGLPSGMTLVKQDAATYVLSGSASVSDYQAALRALSYSDSGQIVSDATLGLTLKVYDVNAQGGASAAPPSWTMSLGLKAHNDAPTVSSVSATTLAYTEGDGATALFAGVALADVDSSNLSSAKVQISAGYRSGQDVLVVDVQALSDAGLTSTFDAVSGTLTLKGVASVAAYQAVIESVAYQNNAQALSEAARTVSLSITDDQGLVSSAATRAVAVTAVADAPDVDLNGRLVAGESSALTYTYGLHHSGGGLLVASQASLSDVDSSRLSGLTIELTQNAQTGDALRLNAAAAAVAANAGLVVSGLGTGTLTLTGSATLLDYENVLRGVLFDADTVANLGFTGGTLPPSRALTVTATDATGAGVVTSVVGSIAQTESSFAFASGSNLYLFGDPGSSAAGDIETVSIDLNAKVISVDGNPLKVDGAPFFGVTNVYGADADGTVDGSMSGVSVGVSGAQLKVAGTSGDNTIVGTSGNDEIRGGGGNDTLAGGAGDDLFYDQAAGTVDGGEGTDTLLVFSSTNSGTHVSATGVEIISAARAAQGVTLTGQLSDATTTLLGSGFADTVVAADGLTLSGGAGSDTFDVSLLTNGQTATITDAAIGEVVVTASTATESGGVITTAEGAVITVANWGTGWSLQQEAVTSTNYHVVVTPAQKPTIASMTRDSGTSASDWLTNDGGARLIKGSIDDPLEASQVLEVSVNGGSTWSAALVDGRAWQFSDTTSARTEGWVIKARVTDTRTNVSSHEADWATQTVSFDASAPGALAVSASGMTNPALVSDAAYTFGSDDAAARTEYSLNYTNAASDVWSSIKPSLHEGANTIYFRQTDGAGNVSAVHTWNVSLDTSPPVITSVAVSDGAFMAGETVQVTVTFDGAVSFSNNATTIDLVLDGGEVAATFDSATTTDGVTSALFTYLVQAGDAASSGVVVKTNGMTLDTTGTIQDAAGNDAVLTFTSVVNQAAIVDTLAPAVTITDDESGTGNIAGGDITYTFTFDEVVTGFTVDDVLVTNGSVVGNSFSEIKAGLVYEVAVTPSVDFEGQLGVDVDTGAALDLAGNSSSVAETSLQSVDTRAPLMVISHDETNEVANIAGGDITYTFTFTEAVSGFTADDVSVVGGGKGAFTGSDGDVVYTLVVTPEANFEGDVTVNVAAAAALDLHANASLMATESAQAVDMRAPSVMISNDETSEIANIAGGDIVYTFTFTEAVTGFSIDDVVVVGGVKGAFTGSDGDTAYTLVVTPDENFDGDITVNVAAAAAIDLHSNSSLIATQSVQAVDTQVPTLEISNDETLEVANIAGGDIIYTFAFSESVWDFNADDVNVTGGVKGTFTGAAGDSVYTLVVTPNAIEGAVTVSVDALAVADAGGNRSDTVVQLVQLVDMVAPSEVTTTLSVAENETSVPGNLQATDGRNVVWSLGSGGDEGLFELSATGVLSLKTAKNYEQDETGDHAYAVNVVATDDAGNQTAQEVTVNLVDVNEAPVLVDASKSPSLTVAEDQTHLVNDSQTSVFTLDLLDAAYVQDPDVFANTSLSVVSGASFKIFSVVGDVETQEATGNLPLADSSTGLMWLDSNGVLQINAANDSVENIFGLNLQTLKGTDKAHVVISYDVKDSSGEVSGESLQADVYLTGVNDAPVYSASPALPKIIKGQPFSYDLRTNFSDIDGDTLAFSLSTDSDWPANLDFTNGVITGTTGDGKGSVNISFDVFDGTVTTTQQLTFEILERPEVVSFSISDDVIGDAQIGKASDTLTFKVQLSEAVTITTPGSIAMDFILDDVPGASSTVLTVSGFALDADTSVLTATVEAPSTASDNNHWTLSAIDLGTAVLEGSLSKLTMLDSTNATTGQTYAAYTLDNTAPIIATPFLGVEGGSASLSDALSLDVDEAVTWSVTSGAADFSNASSGVLTLNAAVFYTDDTPLAIGIQVTDLAGNIDTQTLNVYVTQSQDGTSAGDFITGTESNDAIHLLDGDDEVNESLGHDWVYGGLGFDAFNTSLDASGATLAGTASEHNRTMTLADGSVLSETASGEFVLQANAGWATVLNGVEAVYFSGQQALLNIDGYVVQENTDTGWQLMRYDGTAWEDTLNLDLSSVLGTTGALSYSAAGQISENQGGSDVAVAAFTKITELGETFLALEDASGQRLAEFKDIEFLNTADLTAFINFADLSAVL